MAPDANGRVTSTLKGEGITLALKDGDLKKAGGGGGGTGGDNSHSTTSNNNKDSSSISSGSSSSNLNSNSSSSNGANGGGKLSKAKGHHLSSHELGENAVLIRDAAKGIGRTLTKFENPSSIMIVAKTQEPGLALFTRELARNILDTPRCLTHGLKVYVESRFQTHPTFAFEQLLQKYPHYKNRLLFWDPQFCREKPEEIDFIITLGGDGTVLFATWLFQNSQVPPVLPFHFGSLGFLTVFKITEITNVLNRVIGCDRTGLRLNMRMRLSCVVWKSASTATTATAANLPVSDPLKLDLSKLEINQDDFNVASPNDLHHTKWTSASSTASIPNLAYDNGLGPGAGSYNAYPTNKPYTRKSSFPPASSDKLVPNAKFEVLNDIVIDRGPSAYMSQLEIFVEDRHLTTVQADGLVIATPTGSTAYSLAAGGSLVHPEVPSFLLTPICAHSLSFRPMLLPDSIELKIQVPKDSRNTAFVSFDGRHRMELQQGDFITVKLSRFPMPSVCYVDQSVDWFASLKRSLHWNERARQKGFLAEEVVHHPAEVDSKPMNLEQLAGKLFSDTNGFLP